MPARAIGTGTISFGLVAIPVKLYSASQTSDKVSFNLLHGACSSRLKQQYVCPKDNVVVERDQMVKGYEFQKGQYVTFTDDELKALETQKSEAIEIVEFLPASAVDPIYFDKAYYLGPDKGGDRPYALLSHALRQCQRAALARYSARGKQYLVLIRPIDGGLVMQQLHYADEVKAFSEVPVTDATPKPEELKLAEMLIAQALSEEFKPEKYEDETRKRILALIQQKVDGQEVSTSPEEPTAQIIDLMEALRQSLARKQAAAAQSNPTPAQAAPSEQPAAKASRKSPKPAQEAQQDAPASAAPAAQARSSGTGKAKKKSASGE